MERDISFRALIGRTFALIASDIGAVLLAFIGIVLLSTALDVAMPNGGNLLGLPILVVQYYTIRRLVDRVRLRLPTTTRPTTSRVSPWSGPAVTVIW